jgi:hypothetical protein
MMRFNPPPNWPELPDDFTPTGDWQPDAKRGGVPYGWSLWVEDDGRRQGAGRHARTAPAPLLTPFPDDSPKNSFGGPLGTLQGPTTPDGSLSITTVMVAITLALAGIGLFMSFQPVSLITGEGTLYTGLALIVGARILAWVMKLPRWVRLTTWAAPTVCVINLVTVEHQLSQRRHELQQILTPSSPTPTALPCSTNPGFGCDPTQ